MWMVELGLLPAPERLSARPSHRARLKALHRDGVVPMAGPLADDSGALIVFNVDYWDDLEQLLSADPYFSTTGVSVKSVRQWNPFIT